MKQGVEGLVAFILIPGMITHTHTPTHTILLVYLLWTHVRRVHLCDAEHSVQGADVRYGGAREC